MHKVIDRLEYVLAPLRVTICAGAFVVAGLLPDQSRGRDLQSAIAHATGAERVNVTRDMRRMITVIVLSIFCASCAPAMSAPQYSADDMRRYADATEHVQATQAERAYQKTQEHLATLDTLAVAQTQQAAQLRSDAATATVAAQQARETQAAQQAIVQSTQAALALETQQARRDVAATQSAQATAERELRQRQDAAAVAESWRLGQQALIAIVCILAAFLSFSAWKFMDTMREMYVRKQSVNLALIRATVERERIKSARESIQVLANGAVLRHQPNGPPVIVIPARATASASPAQYQDLPLAGDETQVDGPQAEAVKFLKLCIDWQSANKRDYRMIPSAAQLGMHPEERARYRRLFGEAIIMRPGVGTYVADGTLYDLLRRVGSGDFELVTV